MTKNSNHRTQAALALAVVFLGLGAAFAQNGLGDMFADVGNQIKEDLTNVGQQIANNVTQTANNIADNAAQSAENLAQQVVDGVNNVATNVVNNERLSDAADAWQNIQQTITQAVVNAAQDAANFAQGVAGSATEIGQDLAGSAQDILESVIDWVDNFANATYTDAVDFVKKIESSTRDEVENILEEVAPVMEIAINTVLQGVSYVVSGMRSFLDTAQLPQDAQQMVQGMIDRLVVDGQTLFDDSLTLLGNVTIVNQALQLPENIKNDAQLAAAASVATIAKGYSLIAKSNSYMLEHSDVPAFWIISAMKNTSNSLEQMFRIADDSRIAITALQNITSESADASIAGRRRRLLADDDTIVMGGSNCSRKWFHEDDFEVDVDSMDELRDLLSCGWDSIWQRVDDVITAGSAVTAALLTLVRGVWSKVAQEVTDGIGPCSISKVVDPDLMLSLRTPGDLRPCGYGGCWKCMQAGANGNASSVVVSDCNVWPEDVRQTQGFVVQPIGKGTGLQVVNQGSKQCLTVEADTVVMSDCTGGSSQSWEVMQHAVQITDGFFRLGHKESGKCLGVAPGYYGNGSPLMLEECKCIMQQQFAHALSIF